MQNIDSEIKKSSKASAFTLIVAFVCVALVGVAIIPLLPVKLNPSRTLPGFTVRFSMPGTSARVVEMQQTITRPPPGAAAAKIAQTNPAAGSEPHFAFHNQTK